MNQDLKVLASIERQTDYLHNNLAKLEPKRGNIRALFDFKKLPLSKNRKLQACLHEEIRKLSPLGQRVLVLHYWCDYPFRDIAMKLDLPLESVRSLHEKSLKLLRQGITESIRSSQPLRKEVMNA